MMEKIYAWLFGENKWTQEKKIKKLLIVTIVLTALAFILLIDSPKASGVVLILILLIWGWGFARATMTKVAGIIAFFDSDMAIFVFTLFVWLFFGLAAGALSLLLGIIRFIQLKKTQSETSKQSNKCNGKDIKAGAK